MPLPDPAAAGSWKAWMDPAYPIRLGISSCLLGESVRWDGGHCRDRFLTDVFAEWVEWVSVCPEKELGMGVPRPTIRLVNSDTGPRLLAPSTGEEFTEPMAAYSQRRVAELAEHRLDGYVVKKNSPTCGMVRVRLHDANGKSSTKDAVGAFTGVLRAELPFLPVEEDGRLHDWRLRENFIARVFQHNRWRVLKAGGLTRGKLVQFHTAHKLMLRAHNEQVYMHLGRVLGQAGTRPDAELFDEYERYFLSALETKATAKRQVNVLQHVLGYLKDALDAEEKREILDALEDYRQGLIPLLVPLSLLRAQIRKHDVEYIAGQLYLDPYPKELMLRKQA